MGVPLLVAVCLCGCGSGEQYEEYELTLAQNVNPLVGYVEDGNHIYGGDPSILVDGDTVYLYTGHDASTDEQVADSVYNIPEYLCYSTTNLTDWVYEGVVMTMDTVSWAMDDASAWASQVMKHADSQTGLDKYYLYYCSWDKTSAGKQSIGVAVSDSPTGPFVDIGEPLVPGFKTKPESNRWNDIDPTAWIEVDDAGIEHRYLAWGNGIFYICELNEDMVSVKDIDGDGEVTCGSVVGAGDIVPFMSGLESYTEAPWLYRRSDESGKYYGDYYLFYARGWRESMAYSTISSLLAIEGDLDAPTKWEGGNIIMTPSCTSNTNHMAVFDFKGHTYFVYHTGALPGGNGYRRSACIRELFWNEDGSVEFMTELTSAISDETVSITSPSGARLSHESVINSSDDKEYPMSLDVGLELGVSDVESKWVLKSGKADRTNKFYVSIESEDKSGLFLTAVSERDIELRIDDNKHDTALAQTWHIYSLSSDSTKIILESVAYPGKYIEINSAGELTLSEEKNTGWNIQ